VVHGPTLRAELELLARNLRWFWHEPTLALFRRLAEPSWHELDRNPVAVVAAIGRERMGALARDARFVEEVRALTDDLRDSLMNQDTWFDRVAGDPTRTVAYLSAEFALTDCLRTYSGGLGVLAGDHVRSASSLGLPLVAVGLAYRDGYFRQEIDERGHQHAYPARNDFARLPVSRITGPAGDRITVEVPMGDGTVRVQGWVVHVGRIQVYLLDTDVDGNADHHRAITGQLYGGDADTRIRQELVLGVGGPRFLAALGIRPHVFHLNEGHAAFAGIERLGAHLASRKTVDEAITAVRDELVFTTHTPVPAGHDRFDHGLVHHHLSPLAGQLGLSFDTLWGLATGPGEDRWNQTVLALRLAGRSNGVARLHGEVSRQMWAQLWPERSIDDVPIDHVTNGVHPSSWTGPEIAAVLDGQLGQVWRTDFDPELWEPLRAIEPAVLWRAHTAARHRLLDTVHQRMSRQAARTGAAVNGHGLDPDALTIGFARRFATYKRATLLAHDIDRLADILGSADRPVQLLVAGKAHPQDREGQGLITQLVELSRDPRLAGRLVFLEGYDLELGKALTSGCDVWLNNPLRPMEASGTSGMKAAMNGVLNLSVLDGWWDEAVADLQPLADVGFGWAIGSERTLEDREAQDAADADALYRLLAEQVVPTFNDRGPDGVPHRWVTMMTDAIRVLGPRFSTHRMVADYAQRYGVTPVAVA
jgi:glycogen phosphorylase